MDGVTMIELDYEKYKGGKEDLVFKYTVKRFNTGLPRAVGVYGRNLCDVLFDLEKSIFPSTSVAESVTESVGVWSALRLIKAFVDQNGSEYIPEITPTAIADQLFYIYGDFLLSQSTHLTGNVWHLALGRTDIHIISEQVAAWMEEHLPSDKHPYRVTLEARVWDHWQTN